ncbi:MAG TPA: NAD-dependent epimerase/dehydratase family protein [Casimicrobiaceae bacterium]|nr:NAD-dependent epimerase/dehydratase family protein [Casimicrobiaceae bacterium]
MTASRVGKVLITGAGGFIGRAMRRRLAESGIEHIAAMRALSAEEGDASECVALGDFAAAEWTQVLAGVDAIVHLAGLAHVVRAGDATPYVISNVHVTRRLVDAAARAGVRRVVFASTVKVYGETTVRGRPFRAGDPARPRDDYARSKAEAEKVLWERCRDTGTEGVVLRLPLTYGPGVKGNFLKLMEAIAAGRRLPFGRAANRRSLLYVGNAVAAIEAALSAPELAGETLPVADHPSVSTAELIGRIAQALGVPARLYHAPASLLRVGAFFAGRRRAAAQLLGSLEVDATRFSELAHWSSSATLDQGLAATAAWWRLQHTL